MKKALAFIAIGSWAVVSLALAAGLVLGQFQPREEIARMLIAMAKVETVNESAGISWTREDNTDRTTTTVFTDGQLNLADASALEHGTRFRVVRISKEQEEFVDLSGEVRLLNDTTYLSYDAPGPDVEGLEFEGGTWLEFSKEELALWGPIIPGLDPPIIEEEQKTIPWVPTSIRDLRIFLSRADVFIVDSSEEKEVINGKKTRIFDGRFDPQAIRSFLSEIIRIREGRELNSTERLIVETQGKALEEMRIRLWIGSSDHLLYRIQVGGVFEEVDRSTLTALDVVINLERYNDPFVVGTPENLVSFKEIYNQLFGALSLSALGSLNSGAETVLNDAANLPIDFEVKSNDPDEDGVSNIVEAFYGSDPNNPDTDGDGVNDGDEITAGRSPTGEGSLFGFGLPGT